MSRLIDANNLLEILDEPMAVTSSPQANRTNKMVHDILKKMVEESPTVDAVPVRHGHWKVFQPDKDFPHFAPSYYCSVCEKNSAFVVDGMEPIPPQLFNRLIYHYCPHCGAKMDGGDGHATD